jgi:hypothetical protein
MFWNRGGKTWGGLNPIITLSLFIRIVKKNKIEWKVISLVFVFLKSLFIKKKSNCLSKVVYNIRLMIKVYD